MLWTDKVMDCLYENGFLEFDSVLPLINISEYARISLEKKVTEFNTHVGPLIFFEGSNNVGQKQ